MFCKPPSSISSSTVSATKMCHEQDKIERTSHGSFRRDSLVAATCGGGNYFVDILVSASVKSSLANSDAIKSCERSISLCSIANLD
ncbi:hypothetical protein D5086_022918 [Populus alba]|uniref:Uncharacterized protein n=1 Tax=Populus alba TaxID=43335 RepID=A0ACC4B8W3_POPAL